uniref:protein-tyrosine-phosphatase n=1 Tax=Panagrolaimus davidi TaxID=227884 RepID=A0A914R4U9_9BILA
MQRKINSKSGKFLHYVIHVHHRSWPDLGVPKLTQPIIDIYNEYVDPSVAKKLPVAVHCSAGIGRTGCFIAAYICFLQFKASRLVSVKSAICNIRRMRGRAVQKSSQYFFLHLLLVEMIENFNGQDLSKVKSKFYYILKVVQEKEAKKAAKAAEEKQAQKPTKDAKR